MLSAFIFIYKQKLLTLAFDVNLDGKSEKNVLSWKSKQKLLFFFKLLKKPNNVLRLFIKLISVFLGSYVSEQVLCKYQKIHHISSWHNFNQ